MTYCDYEGPEKQNLWLSQSVLLVGRLHRAGLRDALRREPDVHDPDRAQRDQGPGGAAAAPSKALKVGTAATLTTDRAQRGQGQA